MGLNKSKNLSQAKATADKWFSLYIRLRDSNSNGVSECITCGKVDNWRSFDCGHFQSRRYLSTRYDEFNASSQCVTCNKWGAGEQYKFGKAIDLKYGKGVAESLVRKSREVCKMKKGDVMELARNFKQLAEELAESKGISIK